RSHRRTARTRSRSSRPRRRGSPATRDPARRSTPRARGVARPSSLAPPPQPPAHRRHGGWVVGVLPRDVPPLHRRPGLLRDCTQVVVLFRESVPEPRLRDLTASLLLARREDGDVSLKFAAQLRDLIEERGALF